MIGQIWSALTRRPQSTNGMLGVIEPIVKYRLALYVTATSAHAPSPAGAASFRKFMTPGTPK